MNAPPLRTLIDAALAAGDHPRASELLEQACEFVAAADQALEAQQPGRAAVLAALGGDAASFERACDALLAGPSEAAVRTGGDLAARGFARYAGVLFERLGRHLDAAQAFARAGESIRAAGSFERAGRPAEGARALEAALRTRPEDGSVRLALARLLARHGRTEAAVKTLQKLPPSSRERAEAMPLLARCLGELGLDEAAATVRGEMRRFGISDIVVDDVEDDVDIGAASNASSHDGAAVPGAPQPPAPVLFGRYRVVRDVAATAHARVLEAIDAINGETVAVKVFAGTFEGNGRDALLRFEREARALAQLRHPNVVPLRDYVPEGPAIVLGWMPGGSLADLMRREPVAPARAIEIGCAVLGALGEAHRLGILHRDVKPSNVLFDGIGAPRLADFGAAHLGDLSTTATAGAIGTFAYMSPEQRLGRAATIASDLYAVGAMVYELLTGVVASPSVAGALDPSPSSAHPDLTERHDRIITRFLDADASRRPGDAFEARRLLESCTWSTRVAPAGCARPRARISERPGPTTARLADAGDHGDSHAAGARRHDTWIDRDVLVLPLDAATLARARAFARAGHVALPTVLRVDAASGEIWIAPPLGRALADAPRPLSDEQRARLAGALEMLHAAGGAHGAIDPSHVFVHDGDVALSFPLSSASDDPEDDRRALAAL